jgi:hypothetical protein
MAYDEENIKKIKEKFAEIDHVYTRLVLKLSQLRLKLKNEEACEYLVQGVGRRLNILTRCLHNIFKIFPVEKTDLLPRDDLTDLDINLHAFFVNISGILDNLGWVFVYENDLFGSSEEGKITKFGVGLFNKKTQIHLKPELNTYLKSKKMKTWYIEYSKNYRDALAHRIPLYVPPSALNKEEQEEYMLLEKQLSNFNSVGAILQHDEILDKQSKLGRACPLFAHSLNEGSTPLFLHAQVMADFLTIDEIINKFCDYFKH